MRAIRAAATSDANGGAGDETAGASDRDPALTTDKGSLPFFFVLFAFSARFIGLHAWHADQPEAGWTVGSDIARPPDQRQNFFGDHRRAPGGVK
jgi:hypothetical protein